MSMSGIEVDPDIATLYNEMKIRKTHQFVVLKIENKKKVVIVAKGDKSSTDKSQDEMKRDFEAFVDEHCKENEPAYAIFDFGYTKPDGGKIEKIKFIYWCPDTSKVSDKMIYASTKDSVLKSCSGVGKGLEVSTRSDLDFDEMIKMLKEK